MNKSVPFWSRFVFSVFIDKQEWIVEWVSWNLIRPRITDYIWIHRDTIVTWERRIERVIDGRWRGESRDGTCSIGSHPPPLLACDHVIIKSLEQSVGLTELVTERQEEEPTAARDRPSERETSIHPSVSLLWSPDHRSPWTARWPRPRPSSSSSAWSSGWVQI